MTDANDLLRKRIYATNARLIAATQSAAAAFLAFSKVFARARANANANAAQKDEETP